MKIAGVLLVFAALAACSSVPTLEQLEDQAMLTGDWSAVEKREKLMTRRAQRKGPQCPSGLIAYCEKRLTDLRCVCTDRDSLNGW